GQEPVEAELKIKMINDSNLKGQRPVEAEMKDSDSNLVGIANGEFVLLSKQISFDNEVTIETEKNNEIKGHDKKDELNIENKEIENKEIENKEIENKEIENKEIENKEIENKEIENKEIENKEIENKESDKSEVKLDNAEDIRKIFKEINEKETNESENKNIFKINKNNVNVGVTPKKRVLRNCSKIRNKTKKEELKVKDDNKCNDCKKEAVKGWIDCDVCKHWICEDCSNLKKANIQEQVAKFTRMFKNVFFFLQ
ncbi:unnamed protein product, partial [Meganyctiphanes norvegica]